jgi:2-polyprenyl-3-methyl-5-hydroxy-6-metoxy-1,4-benzoquinol methylase
MNQNEICCPNCGDDLIMSESIICSKCSTKYNINNGIPLLFLPNNWDSEDVTGRVKSFYEETPFPNYEDMENTGDLIQKAERGIFAKLLNEQIPFNCKVLEVGCGTGQLSNFLGIAQRKVTGTDICLNSLILANDFKTRNQLDNVNFYQMNLFKPCFKEESFHLVICNGVLHHTSNPWEGFKSISKLVKKNGYIIIGLYNTFGRLITDVRRAIFNMTNDSFKFLDPRLRNKEIGKTRKLTWFKDQYKHPHESKHTYGEVLEWFDKTGFEFTNCIPKINSSFQANERLFKKNSKGNKLYRFMTQFDLFFKGSQEGGFFIMIGRKKG